MSLTGISANRLELLQIAEAVAREKAIDKEIVIEAIEEAIQKGARSRYGAEHDIRVHIDPKTGAIKEYHTNDQTGPHGLVEGPDGNIWFTSNFRSLIGKLEWVGLVCGPLLLLSQLFAWPRRDAEAKSRIVRILMLGMMTLLVAGSRFYVSAKIHALRAQISGAIDAIPVTDPLRGEFSALHGLSVSLMGATMLIGFIVLFLSVRLWLKR